MTSTSDAIDRVGGQQGQRLEAVVAVEQARAVAQVAAAVQVAQQFPRDMQRVREEVAEATSHIELARVAFYAVPNRGEGLSVHLARELAVIVGNIDYGVHELRRDDAAGMSEVQAFAWDVQRNSRATRTFQVPHAIMRGNRRVAIDDLQDVYRNNQNVGARAVRECVFAVLPRWLVDDAETRCRATLAAGTGVPLEERVRLALGWAKRVRVTQAQLEARVGRPVAEWTPEDLASLEVVATSIGRGETTTEEQFDQGAGRVSPDELTVPPETAPAEPSRTAAAPVGDQRPASRQQVQAVILGLRDVGVESDAEQHAWLTTELQREVTTRNSLTRAEASTVLDVLKVLRAGMPGADEQAGGGAQ